MDTIEGKAVVPDAHSGSFASDGFPMDAEFNGRMMPFHHAKWAAHPKFTPDILFAPGQNNVAGEGSNGEQAIFIANSIYPSISGTATSYYSQRRYSKSRNEPIQYK